MSLKVNVKIVKSKKHFRFWYKKKSKKWWRWWWEYRTVSYKRKLLDTAKIMVGSLSNLVDNLTEGIQKIKCKICNCLLEYKSVNDDLIKHKCLSCNNIYSNKIDERFKKAVQEYKFCNNDINKLILLLTKGVYY